ncbi:MAG: sugar transferase [Bacteroidales bacterium]|nr:sugar transferase [Bacteroidales bacterium]
MDFFNRFISKNIIGFLRRWKLLNIILGGLDILAITMAFQCSYMINYNKTGGFFFQNPRLLSIYLLILPFWLIILYLHHVTEIPRTKRYSALFIEYLQSTAVIIILLMVFYFVFKLYETSRLFLIEMALFGFIFLFIARIIEYKTFKSYRARGYNYVNTVLIADDTSIPFIEQLRSNREWGYKIAMLFSSSTILAEEYKSVFDVLPEKSIKSLYDLMEVEPIDEVLYLKWNVVPGEVRTIIRSCEELGVVFRLRHKESNLNLTNAFNTSIGNEKFLTFINVPYSTSALAFKKITDIFGSLFLLILLSPVLLAISLLIKLTSRGPLIYSQSRVGLRGRPFDLYKFRTMISDAEQKLSELEAMNEADGPVFKIKDDPRVTKVGRFLRKTGLDELPQLVNVLKGEMSLIGPRPPLLEEITQYKRWQLRRLSVKPGLSCFWQIQPERNSIKFEKWMEMDLAYIDNWSLRLDFVILLKTIRTVFKRTGL